MGSELLQRQRVVRQRTERGTRVSEGEVGGQKIVTPVKNGVTWQKRLKSRVAGLLRQKDSPETSTRLSTMS